MWIHFIIQHDILIRLIPEIWMTNLCNALHANPQAVKDIAARQISDFAEKQLAAATRHDWNECRHMRELLYVFLPDILRRGPKLIVDATILSGLPVKIAVCQDSLQFTVPVESPAAGNLIRDIVDRLDIDAVLIEVAVG